MICEIFFSIQVPLFLELLFCRNGISGSTRLGTFIQFAAQILECTRLRLAGGIV